jgi:hypothetical protein
MADDWVDVPPLTPPRPMTTGGRAATGAPPATGPQAPISGPDGWSSAGHDFVNSTPTGGLMKAFGQGFREASGPEPLGLSMESKKWLSKIGIFAPEGQSKFENPFQAFNEGVIVPAAAALDGAIRTFEGTYRGLQGGGCRGRAAARYRQHPRCVRDRRARWEDRDAARIAEGEPGARSRTRSPNPVAGRAGARPRRHRSRASRRSRKARRRKSPKGSSAATPTSRRARRSRRNCRAQQDAWQQRFEGFVGKLEAPDDVKQLIRDAAKENGDFMPARQGDIPLSHVEASRKPPASIRRVSTRAGSAASCRTTTRSARPCG